MTRGSLLLHVAALAWPFVVCGMRFDPPTPGLRQRVLATSAAVAADSGRTAHAITERTRHIAAAHNQPRVHDHPHPAATAGLETEGEVPNTAPCARASASYVVQAARMCVRATEGAGTGSYGHPAPARGPLRRHRRAWPEPAACSSHAFLQCVEEGGHRGFCTTSNEFLPAEAVDLVACKSQPTVFGYHRGVARWVSVAAVI